MEKHITKDNYKEFIDTLREIHFELFVELGYREFYFIEYTSKRGECDFQELDDIKSEIKFWIDDGIDDDDPDTKKQSDDFLEFLNEIYIISKESPKYKI